MVSIGQMLTIKRFFINEDKIRRRLTTTGPRPVHRTKPSFMERLQEAAKEAEKEAKGNRAQEERRPGQGKEEMRGCCPGLWRWMFGGLAAPPNTISSGSDGCSWWLGTYACHGRCPCILCVLSDGRATLEVGRFCDEAFGVRCRKGAHRQVDVASGAWWPTRPGPWASTLGQPLRRPPGDGLAFATVTIQARR